MTEKLKEIPQRILAWWNKFSVKQKTLIASVAVVVVIALAILIKVVMTPTMVVIRTCEDTKEAAEVKNLLDGNDIYFDVSNDGLVFKVKAEDEANAAILLGENGISASTYDYSNLEGVFDGGFSTTESDKSKRYQYYMEQLLAEQLEAQEVIDTARVKLNVPIDDGTILARNQDTYAAVTLTLNDSMDEETAAGLARWIATAIGNDTTDNVSIIDTKGNSLYMGGDSSTSMGAATTQLSYKSKAENMIKNNVKEVVLATEYDNVSVGLNLDMDFDQTNVIDNEVYAPDGEEHGPVQESRDYESETTGGVAATPGTDTNDEDGTTYMMEDGSISSSTITDQSRTYENSQRTTEKIGSVGNINYETSSITLALSSYRFYDEATLKASGELDDMTYEEFQAANSERVKLEVDPDFVQMVAMATGFPEENIKIVAYEIPYFDTGDVGKRDIMDYLPLLIALLIMVMLGYVVFRSTRKEQVEELEPELSVETLLASTKEAQENLEDIGFTEKSETRVLIEKFVDENPEAVASLLRNWLNEEWE